MTWLEETLQNMSDGELYELFQEICDFHKKGVLQEDAKLRKFVNEYWKQYEIPKESAIFCTTEMAMEHEILFEISKRHFKEKKRYLIAYHHSDFIRDNIGPWISRSFDILEEAKEEAEKLKKEGHIRVTIFIVSTDYLIKYITWDYVEEHKVDF